jgi:hypothetical protein
MDFVNTAPYPAVLASGSTGDGEMVYSIACKITCRIEKDRLSPVVGEGAWPVFEAPFVYEGVVLAPELDVRKQGVDLLVFGQARTPGGRPATKQLVGVECGKLRYEVLVIGDRVWTNNAGSLVPSEPRTFVEMPLTNDRAFGGSPTMDGLPMPHPINPAGRGFYLSPETAEDKPLPNLEFPDALIRNLEDKPAPACFFKPQGNVLVKLEGENDIDELFRESVRYGFNQTIPALVAAPEDLGPALRLHGFSPEGDLTFPMPPQSGPTAHVTTGARRSCFPSALSTVVALVDEQVLVATYLCAFRYLMQPLEKRRVELRWSGDRRVA